MTMVEVLLALALLSMLAVAAAAWTAGATRSMMVCGDGVRWRVAAEECLAYMHETILAFERPTRRDRRGGRVQVGTSCVRVDARQIVPSGGGPVADATEFAFDAGWLTATYLDTGERELSRRPLLGALDGVEVELSELDVTLTLLRVTIIGRNGARVEREWVLPTEVIR